MPRAARRPSLPPVGRAVVPRATRVPHARPARRTGRTEDVAVPPVVATGASHPFYCVVNPDGTYGVIQTTNGLFAAQVEGTFATPRAAIDFCTRLNGR